MTAVDKVALVSGAGSGIGRAVAQALLNQGYAVALTGRRSDPLEETAAAVGAPRDKVLTVPADISDPAAVERLFSALRDRFGRLDLLFNNAGTGTPPLTVDELSWEQWKAVVDVNLHGAFLCARSAFRLMREQRPRGGRIINNGSISAHVPRPGSAAYTATKHAITGLTRSIALDGRPYDIACGQIDIGNAGTEMTAPMRTGVPQADGTKKPEPVMDVQHVARSVLLMADMPLDTNVLFMTVMATKMPYVGRG